MKTKELMLIGLMGVGLFGFILMAASVPKVDNSISTVNQEVVNDPNNQYVVKASCYVCPPYCGKMANGEVVHEGAIAIRRISNIIKNMGLKLGDKVFIEGYGTYEVEDVMADTVKADIDIYMDVSEKECLDWGLKNLVIEKL